MSPRATTRPSCASITNTLRLLCTSSPTYDSIGLPSSLSLGRIATPWLAVDLTAAEGSPPSWIRYRGFRKLEPLWCLSVLAAALPAEVAVGQPGRHLENAATQKMLYSVPRSELCGRPTAALPDLSGKCRDEVTRGAPFGRLPAFDPGPSFAVETGGKGRLQRTSACRRVCVPGHPDHGGSPVCRPRGRRDPQPRPDLLRGRAHLLD